LLRLFKAGGVFAGFSGETSTSTCTSVRFSTMELREDLTLFSRLLGVL